MSEIGGMQLSGVLSPADYDDIRLAAENAQCELIDATHLDVFSTQLVDVVREAIERQPGPRVRVAIVTTLDAWALFGEKLNTGVPALRMFHTRQLESFTVQRWIRAGTTPDPDIPRVLADLDEWLGGEASTAIVHGVARVIRRSSEGERAQNLARLVEIARRYVPARELERLQGDA